MKIRSCFVSNSSSSSFCMYGRYNPELNEDNQTKEADELLKLLCKHDKRFFTVCAPDDDYWYYGIPWSRIKDDETGLEFKTKIEKAIEAVFGPQTEKCETIEEAWYDG